MIYHLKLRYQKQLDDVKNNREFDALTKELELQKLEIQLSEKRIKEAAVKVDAKKLVLDEAQENFDQKEKNLETKKVELEKIIAKTERQERKLVKASKADQKGIEERLIKAYTKIRGRYRNGKAVVHVQRDSCGGCFNKIPPQRQLDIQAKKKVIVCEHCGRVLVPSEEAD